MSTGCEFYADGLVALAGDDLDPGRAERLQAHVETCDDCRAALEVIRAVRAAPAPVPEGLDDRIRAAVRGSAADSPIPFPAPGQRAGRLRPRWRAWALPAVAAAALAVWIGTGDLLGPGPDRQEVDAELAADYDPYGAWPASDGIVAGDLVLSELSVEELEALLEEMRR